MYFYELTTLIGEKGKLFFQLFCNLFILCCADPNKRFEKPQELVEVNFTFVISKLQLLATVYSDVIIVHHSVYSLYA